MECLATAGRGVYRAVSFSAHHAKECAQTAGRSIWRAGSWFLRQTKECGQTLGRSLNRGMEDINPYKAARRYLHEALLFAETEEDKTVSMQAKNRNSFFQADTGTGQSNNAPIQALVN